MPKIFSYIWNEIVPKCSLKYIYCLDDEIVDPRDNLKEKCAKQAKCQAFQEKLNTCNTRVNSRKKTAETCFEELIDFVHCVDHCIAKDLFNYLK